ncbi:FAD/NAD(P)-binding domain-containing protein [Aspergillus steynii IBT 23096]|uniref:FAD/NAD(P)-binding domain-containing protein n=1 Tax=Aspergillus steynii IBT 23096 TaxID=1392250 RepID=A0A2I2G0E0_9EURO|nr:FAD/NAD(P)-binding domain-containing protein [Aspergillus steynii IBT 23096]PLB46344.1 FAD/NAD(P)-binding domain-containing protein [Aspergillus steynii IBT 23096]
MESQHFGWRPLDVAVIGGGIGGLAAATSLRRAGHAVTIYERADYAGEVGASISCGANGTRWLEDWNVDISVGRPIVIEKLIRHDLETGEVQDVYDLADYAPYYNFYRVDMHAMLMQSATGPGQGKPAVLKLNHACETVDHRTGVVTFRSVTRARHDLVICADGVGSAVRQSLGIHPERKAATSTSYHCIIPTAKVRRLGLPDMSVHNALEYWGGHGPSKIIFSACRGGEIHSFYTFFANPRGETAEEGWDFSGSREQLLAPFPKLDPALRAVLSHAGDIKPWRLYVHSPYPRWHRGRTGLLGDAAHPMLPDQSQGACQAIEDAAALGIIFGPRYTFTADVAAGLRLYEQVRKPRASRVQEASARARENLSERIGFSSQKDSSLYKVAHKGQKLTIEEVNEYVIYCALGLVKHNPSANSPCRYDIHGHIATQARSLLSRRMEPGTLASQQHKAERLSRL